jgi:predicted  nucleic acid-binding Zn-ribbon protein
MSTPIALTREQKLLAEIIVQLGNVTEAIRAAAAGEDSSTLMTQIATLQSELTNLTSQNATLAQQLADANGMVADLQSQLSVVSDGDITPDNINEVISHLGIEVPQ